MTSPEPKSADLIATDPTTVLPWELARAVLADTRLYWLATVLPTGPPPYLPYEIAPSTVFAFGTADGYGSRTTRYRF